MTIRDTYPRDEEGKKYCVSCGEHITEDNQSSDPDDLAVNDCCADCEERWRESCNL